MVYYTPHLVETMTFCYLISVVMYLTPLLEAFLLLFGLMEPHLRIHSPYFVLNESHHAMRR